MKPPSVEVIFATFAAAAPHPKTELIAPNAFCLLVAIVLSAQATDVSVNKATVALFKRADTPRKLLALGEGGIKDYIKTIGLYNAKAKNVMALCQRLLTEYDGQVPTTREELETLPGVGRKTANVWLNCALGLPTIGVDTHVFRVANRLGLCATSNPLTTEAALEKTISAKWKQHAHHWLILHGRYVCKARKPECYRCGVAKWCAYPAKTV
ncbi:MAG: endonuclease III [Rickettsiales bacterium]